MPLQSGLFRTVTTLVLLIVGTRAELASAADSNYPNRPVAWSSRLLRVAGSTLLRASSRPG